MTNQDILEIAMSQSAKDNSCNAEDFRTGVNKVVLSCDNSAARRYLALPFYCNLVSYGNNVVAAVHEDFADIAKRYIDKYAVEHCFETPSMNSLSDELGKVDMRVCFMAEYFLPDVDILQALPCGYDVRILNPIDFSAYYLPEWGNALCENRKHLDKLAIGAFDKERLVGLAGCSADCETMWQIGIDVLPNYRQKGIAAALTSRLACEILKLGIVPFYCAAWSNIKSVRNAIKSGFRPAWVEMTAKSKEFIAGLNGTF